MADQDHKSAAFTVSAFRITGIYSVVSLAWILLSAGLLQVSGEAGGNLALLNIVNGAAYILVTACLLHLFTARWARRADRQLRQMARQVDDIVLAEQQISRLKDTYAALSQTNQCILHAATREELFATICRIAIEHGHFRLAWIGLADPVGQAIHPVEAAGEGQGYLDGVQLSTDPASPFNHGTGGQAFSTGRYCITNDMAATENVRPWLSKATQFGIASSAAFPLFCGGQAIGILVLHSGEVGFFTPDLIALLDEMAQDISFALDRMEEEVRRKALERDLAASNARVRGIIEGTQDIIATIDAEMRFTDCNQAYQAFVRQQFGQALRPGTSLHELLGDEPGRVDRFSERWPRALAGEHFSVEWEIGQGDSLTYYDSHYGPLLDPSGRLIGAFHVGRDVSQRKRMEFELRKLSVAIEQSPVTVVITDSAGVIQYVNPAFTANSGYTAEEAIGRTPAILKSGTTTIEEYRAMWDRIRGGNPWSGQFRNKRKDGSIFWEEAVIAPVRDGDGAICQYIGVKQDITKRREAEESTAFLTYHDALTRLPNRVLGQDRMERAMINADRQHSKSALLLVNVDHFKRVNDSLGMAAGDALLLALVDRIRGCIRETDTLSRQGSDDFLVVLASVTDPEAINRIAAHILERAVRPFTIQGAELSITVSIGIAVYPDDGADFEALLRRANLAMRHAKDAGRNTYRFFGERMNVDANEYLVILNGLRRALDRCEFVLHYQPQYALGSGEVIGAEALIRWNNPDLGLVQPGKFISIAEDSGLIVDMGKWVLREACRQAVAWQALAGRPIVVAVNLSAIQFKRGGLVESVQQALTESGLDPSCLELELTESILIKDTVNVLAAVRQLKALGLRLSIDDFGTGYSSLAYLRLLDLDKLKIDQSFVRDISDNPDNDTIVKAIVQLAKGLGLKTIAEGVETRDALEVLRAHGCDEVQGFYFAKPMPADQFTAQLQR